MSFAFRWEKHFPNWILFVAPLPPPTIRQSHPCLWGYRSNKFQPLPGSICITFCGTARTALPLTSWNGFANDWKVNFLSSPAGQQLYSTVFLFRGKWLLIRYLAASLLVGGLAGHQFGYLPSGPKKVSQDFFLTHCSEFSGYRLRNGHLHDLVHITCIISVAK